MKKNIGLKILLILGIIAFISMIIGSYNLFQVWKNTLPRESFEGQIVNISLIPMILFFISFFIIITYKYIKYIRGSNEYEKESRSVFITVGLGFLAFFFFFLDFLALTDIGQGDADLTLEWGFLPISLIPFMLFFLSFFLTGKKLLSKGSKKKSNLTFNQLILYIFETSQNFI